MPTFKVKLVQREWVNTETFESTDPTVFPDQPENETEAKATVEKFLAKHKELGDTEYRLEVETIEDQAPEAPADIPEAEVVSEPTNDKESK